MHPIGRAACVVALCLAVLAPTSAHAQRWSSPDPAGDVHGWHYDPEPKPCGTSTEVDGARQRNADITRLTVRHGRKSVVVRVRFRDLLGRLEQMVSVFIRTSRGGWWLDVDRFEMAPGKFRVMTFLMEEPELPEPEPVDPEDPAACDGVSIIGEDMPCRITRRVDLTADVVHVAVPRTCLRKPRWIRVAAEAHQVIETDDPADRAFTVFSDEWEHGVELSEWMPPFGPRLRAG